eukprot:scaffold3356_cov112-Isochrysis_galbana.AAC.12
MRPEPKVEHAPGRHAGRGSLRQLARDAVCARHNLDSPAAPLKHLGHDRLVLNRVEGAGRVAHRPAHPQQRHAAQRDAQLQPVLPEPVCNLPPVEDFGMFAGCTVASARHVAHDLVEAGRRTAGRPAGHALGPVLRHHQRGTGRVGIVGHHDSTTTRAGELRSQSLDELGRLAARGGAHVQHTLAGLHVEQASRQHRSHLLPDQQPPIGPSHEPLAHLGLLAPGHPGAQLVLVHVELPAVDGAEPPRAPAVGLPALQVLLARAAERGVRIGGVAEGDRERQMQAVAELLPVVPRHDLLQPVVHVKLGLGPPRVLIWPRPGAVTCCALKGRGDTCGALLSG